MTTVELERMIVRIMGDSSHYERTIKHATTVTKQFAADMVSVGTKMTTAVTAPIAVGFGAAIKEFASYEQGLADIQAAANPTAEQMKQLDAAIKKTAQTTGVSATNTAKAFGELVKAGASVDAVVNGLGETTAKFAKVAGIATDQAAQVLIIGTTIFGESADRMANLISQASDASVASLADVVAAFSSGGSVLAMFNQNAEDTATAIAALANAGVIGADAGTALKSAFLHMGTGNSEVAQIVKQYGLELRDATGKMKPMLALIDELQAKLSGLGEGENQEAVAKLFGSYGIKAGAALLKLGTQGFTDLKKSMQSAMSVEEKFALVMKTLKGQFDRIVVSIGLVAIEIGEMLAPTLQQLVEGIKSVVEWWKALSPETKQFIVIAAAIVAAIGPLLLGLGLIPMLWGTIAAGASILAPLLPIIVGLGLAVYGFILASGGIKPAFEKAKQAVNDFIQWVKPIWQATVDFFVAAWPLLKEAAIEAWEDLKRKVAIAVDSVRLAMGYMLGDMTMSWTQIRDTIVNAIQMATFAIENFELANRVAAAKVTKYWYDQANAKTFGLGGVIDDYTLGLGKALEEQIAEGERAFEAFKKKRAKKEEVKPPEILKPEALNEIVDRAKRTGAQAGKQFKDAMRGELQRVDAALIGSAEGVFRVAEYRNRLRGTGEGKPGATPSGAPTANVFNPKQGAEPKSVIDILTKIHNTLQEKNKNGVEIDVAALA